MSTYDPDRENVIMEVIGQGFHLQLQSRSDDGFFLAIYHGKNLVYSIIIRDLQLALHIAKQLAVKKIFKELGTK